MPHTSSSTYQQGLNLYTSLDAWIAVDPSLFLSFLPGIFFTRECMCVLKTFVLCIKVVQFIRIGVCYTWTMRALTFDKANGVKRKKVRCKRQTQEMGASCVLVEGVKICLICLWVL